MLQKLQLIYKHIYVYKNIFMDKVPLKKFKKATKGTFKTNHNPY